MGESLVESIPKEVVAITILVDLDSGHCKALIPPEIDDELSRVIMRLMGKEGKPCQ